MAEGGVGKGGDRGEEPGSLQGGQQQSMHGAGHCKWFNVRMGFGFISMTSRGGTPVDPPMDVFVHQSKLHMEGFRSLREGEPLEFTFQMSLRGLESVQVTGPGEAPAWAVRGDRNPSPQPRSRDGSQKETDAITVEN